MNEECKHCGQDLTLPANCKLWCKFCFEQNKYDNEMTFTVVSYCQLTEYHKCVNQVGKERFIDLNVAAVFDREYHDDNWFIGKTFVGEVKPYTWIAYRFEEVKK